MLCPSDSRHMRERKWEKIGYNHDSLLFVMTLQCLHISTIILKVFPPLKEGVMLFLTLSLEDFLLIRV